MSFLSSRFEHFDWVLLASLAPLVCAGLVTFTSFGSESYYFSRQLIWICVALAVFFTASFVDWRFLRNSKVVISLYLIAIGVLGALLLVGSIFRGAQSWFSLGFFAIQPVDLAKLVLVITLAKYFSRRHIEIAYFKNIVISGVYCLGLMLLVLAQPDFGSGVIVFLIWFSIVIVSGIAPKHLALVFGAGLGVFAILWFFVFAPYQKDRVLTFLDPERDIRGSGYNAFQSVVAVGSGGVTGKGVGYGTQSRLSYLPEYETDFVFAAFAEEWGFVGVIILFIFLGLVVWRVLMSASLGSTNFELFFGVGVAIIIMSHVVINVGMNIGLLPVTGVTMPFMSYGGSHLVAEFLGLGMVMGMRRYSRAAHSEVTDQELLGPA
jgi:rod shape determining protein RodA